MNGRFIGSVADIRCVYHHWDPVGHKQKSHVTGIDETSVTKKDHVHEHEQYCTSTEKYLKCSFILHLFIHS